MNLVKLDDKATGIIILILIAIFSLKFLGFAGFKVIFGMLLVFLLPSYLILNNFNLERSEKLIFAFFLGIGLIPAIVYWLGVFMSFKLAIAVAFILFLAAGFLIKKIKKK